MIKYPCPACKTILENSPELVGQNDNCPACGVSHVVPESKPTISPETKEAARRLAAASGAAGLQAGKVAGKAGLKGASIFARLTGRAALWLGKASLKVAGKSAKAISGKIAESKAEKQREKESELRKRERSLKIYDMAMEYYKHNTTRADRKADTKRGPTDNQLSYLSSMGYRGPFPSNVAIASILITFITNRGGRKYFDKAE